MTQWMMLLGGRYNYAANVTKKPQFHCKLTDIPKGLRLEYYGATEADAIRAAMEAFDALEENAPDKTL